MSDSKESRPDGLAGLVAEFNSLPEPSTTAINRLMSYIDVHAPELAAAPAEHRKLVEATLHAVGEILYMRRENLALSLGWTNRQRLYEDQFARIERVRGVMGFPSPESWHVIF